MQTRLIHEHKDKIINTKNTRGFNVIQPTMLTSMDERESFQYVYIKIITEDRTKTLQRK